MEALVHQRPAVHRVGAAPRGAVVVRLGAVPLRAGLPERQPAEGTVVEQALQLGQARLEAVLGDHGQRHSGRTRRADEPGGATHPGGQHWCGAGAAGTVGAVAFDPDPLEGSGGDDRTGRAPRPQIRGTASPGSSGQGHVHPELGCPPSCCLLSRRRPRRPGRVRRARPAGRPGGAAARIAVRSDEAPAGLRAADMILDAPEGAAKLCRRCCSRREGSDAYSATAATCPRRP